MSKYGYIRIIDRSSGEAVFTPPSGKWVIAHFCWCNWIFGVSWKHGFNLHIGPFCLMIS